MEILYINLDGDTDRRSFLESNLRQFNSRNWPVHRVEAVDKRNLPTDSSAPGISDGATACFLSHRKAIALAMQHDDDVLVLEDDALFGAYTAASIERAVAQAGRNAWDILFTDVCVPDLETMIHLFQLKRSLKDETVLLDLSELPFAGSTAYIVNRAKKAKLLQLIGGSPKIDAPYDLHLRRLIYEKQLFGHVAFPFPTSLSEYADATGIQPSRTIVADVLWNAFRRLVSPASDLTEVSARLDSVGKEYLSDKEAQLFGGILGGLLSENFSSK